MSRDVLLSASGTMFLIAFVALAFSYHYFHFSNKHGLLGKEYHKKTEKPFASMLVCVLAADFMTAAITLLVLGLKF